MPSTLARKGRDAAATLIDHLPERATRPLADPPAGSGLKPVLGDPGVPVLGHTLAFLQDPIGVTRDSYARLGTVTWGSAFGITIVSAIGPNAIETVLVNRDKAFSNKTGWEEFIGPFFDRGVMLMDFDEHRHHRRIMQHAFKRERLVSYLDAMHPAIERGLASWPNGPDFKLYEATKQLTLDIATEVFVGSRTGAEADKLNQAFIDCVVGGQAIVRADVPGGKWHRGLRSRRLLEDHFRSMIPAKRAAEGTDLFSVLCHAESEDGERFSDDDVVNHMIFTMMAAHDTSTITVAMMAYYLAKHPEWQERLRAEADALGKDAIGYEDVDALPLMDLAFKETLRMNAPVSMLARKAIRDTEIDGYFVPEGSTVTVGIYTSQRLEPWWNDPDTFDPERFTPERAEDSSHKYAWTPFGGGVHKCIGMHFGSMEVKAILYQLLRSRRWTVRAGYEPPIDFGTGPFPGDGLPVTLMPR